MGDAPHHAQALSRPHHLAHLGAGDRGPAPRARLRSGRRRLDPCRRQPEDGDGQQHPRAGRPDDGAIFAAVLRRAGASPRRARSGLVQRQIVQRSGDPRAGAARDHLGGGRGQARPQHRLDGHRHAQRRPRAHPPRRKLQGHAGAAARPRRDAREIPAADPPLRPRGDGAAVRAAAEHRRANAISTGSRSRRRKENPASRSPRTAAAKRAPQKRKKK